jgi:hypothetical protein
MPNPNQQRRALQRRAFFMRIFEAQRWTAKIALRRRLGFDGF